jgi:hypothetical protein
MFLRKSACYKSLLVGVLPCILSVPPYCEKFLSILGMEELLSGMNRRAERDTSMYLTNIEDPPGTRLH